MDAADFRFDSPWGPIYGYFSALGLQTLCLPDPRRPLAPYMLHSRHNRVWGKRLETLFADYFAGVIVDFREVPLDWAGGTPFQRAVWTAARDLPWGQTVSYGELARRIGSPGAARAVGAALGANPTAVVVPCHRILAASAALGGFSSGLDWKRRLLTLEGVPFKE